MRAFRDIPDNSKPEDLRIDYYSHGGSEPVGELRLTHIPTGVAVKASTSRAAMDKLVAALETYHKEAVLQDVLEQRVGVSASEKCNEY